MKGARMRFMPAVLSTLLALTWLPSTAEACSCSRVDVVQAFRYADDTFVGRVQGVQYGRHWDVYDVLVLDSIASCLRERRVVQIATRSTGAECGARLRIGERYLLFTRDEVFGGHTRRTTSLCSGNRRLWSLTADELAFLDARPTDCGGVAGCADGSLPVSCVADPCTVAPPCGPSPVCESNYCGGCTAEFYDPADNTAACTPW